MKEASNDSFSERGIRKLKLNSNETKRMTCRFLSSLSTHPGNLRDQLNAQFAESTGLETQIKANLEGLGL